MSLLNINVFNLCTEYRMPVVKMLAKIGRANVKYMVNF